MRTKDTPSKTAALVAALRRWGTWLPPPLCDLAPDAHGAALAGGVYAFLDSVFEAWPRLARVLARHTVFGRAAASMALRTRCLDDAVRSFATAPGVPRQIVILGAGLDARAWRLADELRGITIFEVDAPGSQRAKLAALARAGLDASAVRFVAHDFEADGADALLAKLRDAGLDATSPVLTIWEAVTMYINRSAVAATLASIRAYSGHAGSLLAVSYLQKPAAPRPLRARLAPWLSPAAWLFRALALSAGEAFRTTFAPGEAREWLAQHGVTMRWDKSYSDIMAELHLLDAEPSSAEVRAVLRGVTSAVSGTSNGHRFVLADLAGGSR